MPHQFLLNKNIAFFLITPAVSMELFGHMDQNKDQILDWLFCQVKII